MMLQGSGMRHSITVTTNSPYKKNNKGVLFKSSLESLLKPEKIPVEEVGMTAHQINKRYIEEPSTLGNSPGISPHKTVYVQMK